MEGDLTMSAYVVIRVRIFDPAALRPYFTQVDAVIENYGGRVLARGTGEILEGEDDARLAVVIAFPDMGRLRAFWHSPEAAPLFELRRRHSNVVAVAVAGVD